MPKITNYSELIGTRINDLVFLKDLGVIETNGKKGRKFLFECTACRNTKKLDPGSVVSGRAKSCGCKPGYKHGQRFTRLYNVWLNMKSRCLWPLNKCYHHYGGRGITICESWKNNFTAFHEWAVSNGYNDKLEIERLDSNGNYEPSNCAWATRLQQCNNTSRNVKYEFNGEMLTLPAIGRLVNIHPLTLYKRIHRNGVSIYEAISIPHGAKVKSYLKNNPVDGNSSLQK